MSRMTSDNERPSETTETVAVVIPTLNEERSIGKVIDGVPVADLLQNGLKTVVYVVDGRSADHTRDIAVQKGGQIITEGRRGKGAAIQTAFQAVDADYVIVVDADNTYPISVATEMVRPLQKNGVVIGSRLKESIELGAMRRLNVAGNFLLASLARLLFHMKMRDVCSRLWGCRRDVMRRSELAARCFEIKADTFAECVTNDLRNAESPITYMHGRINRSCRHRPTALKGLFDASNVCTDST